MSEPLAPEPTQVQGRLEYLPRPVSIQLLRALLLVPLATGLVLGAARKLGVYHRQATWRLEGPGLLLEEELYIWNHKLRTQKLLLPQAELKELAYVESGSGKALALGSLAWLLGSSLGLGFFSYAWSKAALGRSVCLLALAFFLGGAVVDYLGTRLAFRPTGRLGGLRLRLRGGPARLLRVEASEAAEAFFEACRQSWAVKSPAEPELSVPQLG